MQERDLVTGGTVCLSVSLSVCLSVCHKPVLCEDKCW